MILIPLALSAPALLQGPSPLLRIDAPTGVVGFGTFAVDVGDQDGDGVPDVLASEHGTAVRLFSGATGALLRSHVLPLNAQGPVGLVPVDEDADGDLEVLVLHRSGSFLEVLGVEPWTGAVLWTADDFTGRLREDDSEVRAAVLRDPSGVAYGVAFGQPDQVPFHPGWWLSSVTYLGLGSSPGFSNSPLVIGSGASMGEGVVALEDRDGNGFADLAYSAPNAPGAGPAGRVTVQGAFGWEAEGSSSTAEFGEALVRVGDVDGDGFDDLVAVETTGASPATLRLRILDTTDGSTLHSRDFAREAYLGRAHEVEMVSLDDVDADGVEDFALYVPEVDSVHGEPATPMLRVHSGATLAVLATWTDLIAELAGNDPDRLEISPAGDIDGDGLRDLLVASRGGPNGGVVAVLRVRPVLGDLGCPGAQPNSTGETARVELSGTDLLSGDDLALVGSHLPPVAFTLPLASLDVASVTLGDGTLCLGGSILRLNALIARSTIAGTVSADVGIGSWPGLYSVTAQVGERWHFQLWYRDLVGGVATSNLSDTRSVLLR